VATIIHENRQCRCIKNVH